MVWAGRRAPAHASQARRVSPLAWPDPVVPAVRALVCAQVEPRSVLNHKLVLLGDTSVGKSCLAVRFVRDEFSEYLDPTIGGEASPPAPAPALPLSLSAGQSVAPTP